MDIIKKFSALSSKVKAIIFGGIALVAVLAVVLCIVLTGNEGSSTASDSSSAATDTSAEGESTAESNDGTSDEYSLTIKSEDGLLLEGVTVFIYADEGCEDLKNVLNTDGEGKISFALKGLSSYYVKLENVPKGLNCQEVYGISESNVEIVLAIELGAADGWEEQTFGKGDIMFDFTVTDTDGNEHTLSQMLEDKGVVVLNFWYVNCGPCRSEFPHLQEAYEAYADKLALIAISPVDKADAVTEFKAEMELTFPMVAEGIEWEKAFSVTGYPTTVVINRYGRIVLYHTGTIPSTDTFTDMFEYFTNDSYDGNVVDDISDIVSEDNGSDDPGEEEINNPTEVGGVTEFELTVKPGEVVYCDVYKVSGMMLSLESENAYVVCGDDTYEPQNGVISFLMVSDSTFAPINIGVGNTGEETETFKIRFGFLQGTAGNPYPLSLGDFNVRVNAGNDQGVYYEYKAPQTGTLTLKCGAVSPSVAYDFSLYNLNSYAYRTNESDGEKDSDGKPTVSIAVKKGDTVQITVGTLPDESNSYPAASFAFTASFEAGEDNDDPNDDPVDTVEYKVKAVDDEGKPVQNMLFKFVANGNSMSVMTDENGEAIIAIAAESCEVEASPLPGYVAEPASFTLTKDEAGKTVTVSRVVETKSEYTVYVKDNEGNAMEGVSVSVGSALATTDTGGKAVFILTESDSYTAFVSVPEGYTIKEGSLSFGTGKTLTATLTAEEISVPTVPVTYTVTVKDANGAPCTNAAVVFIQNGVQVAMQNVNASGTASVSLPEGDYTTNIVFSGAELFYDKSTACLTSERRSVTVTVAPAIANEFTALYLGNAYNLPLGSYYANTKANASTDESAEGISFFAFIPEESGLYSISITNPEAEFSYWGGNLSFLFDLTSTTDMENNSFTVNVKDSNLGITYVIGVKGTEGCVITAKRIGNYIPNVDDYEWVIYEAETDPKPFSIALGAGQSLTYFDVSGKTDDYKLVYNSADKYYHLGTANGPIVYINLGVDAPFISIKTALETSGLKKYFYDEDGNFVKKEDYTECMNEYITCIDEKLGIYPLTDDLIYIIQNRGEFEGWWDKDAPNFLLTTVNNINPDIAWMFLLCYVK